METISFLDNLTTVGWS